MLRFCSKQLVEVLALQDQGKGTGTSFRQIAQFETKCRPVLLQNELLAIGDDSVETHIIDLRTGRSTLLEGSNPPIDHQFQVCSTFPHKYDLLIPLRSTTDVSASY